jgi:hypothetical protein
MSAHRANLLQSGMLGACLGTTGITDNRPWPKKAQFRAASPSRGDARFEYSHRLHLQR